MLKEVKKFVQNLRRVVLNEGVGSNKIVDAINNRKYLYIYYSGDDTIMTGYRIIKPYVLGVTLAGNQAVRAWESEGGSDSFYGIGVDKRQRPDHEIFDGMEGERAKVPGWRLFLLDNITQIYPTGKTFSGFPPLYNPKDKGMISIQAAIPMDGETGVTKEREDITKEDVIDFVDMVKRVKKRPTELYTVVYDKDGNKDVVTTNQAKTLPQEDVIGNLKDLYNSIVLPTIKKDDSYLRRKRDDFFREMEDK